jgi:hypothetical protein
VNQSSISFKLLRKRKSNSTRHLTEALESAAKDCELFLNIAEKALLGSGCPKRGGQSMQSRDKEF